MALILAIYPTRTSQERTKAMLFCHWDLSQHEKPMPPYYLYSAIFKMAASEFNYVFTYYSTSRIDGDKILVSKTMFFWMKNTMITLQKPIGLLVNAEFKLAVFEINRNDINWSMGPMDSHAPARNV